MTGWLDFLMRIEDRSGGAASVFALLIHFISQHLAEFLDPTRCPFWVRVPAANHVTQSSFSFFATPTFSHQLNQALKTLERVPISFIVVQNCVFPCQAFQSWLSPGEVVRSVAQYLE